MEIIKKDYSVIPPVIATYALSAGLVSVAKAHDKAAMLYLLISAGFFFMAALMRGEQCRNS